MHEYVHPRGWRGIENMELDLILITSSINVVDFAALDQALLQP